MQAMEAMVLAMACMGDRMRALEVENARLAQENAKLKEVEVGKKALSLLSKEK